MDYSRHIAYFEQQSAALIELVAGSSGGIRVAGCPEWTLPELLTHAAGAWGWADAAVRAGEASTPPESVRPPQDPAEQLPWVRSIREQLIQTLRTRAADSSCWAFRFAPQQASFWARRAAHEAAIHHLDAQLALGHNPALLFDPEFATDGIDELLVDLMPALSRRRAPIATDALLRFHTADTSATWHVRYTAGKPIEVAADQDARLQADLSVSGTADSVYRQVWGRPSSAVVTGDAALQDRIAAP
ncbi:MAG: maleylpyruvate isomerase family mycothiol-dependent enzyme [Sciscionella sp.]